MAQCVLNLLHPRFTASIDPDPDVQTGLSNLCKKLAKDHRLSNWFIQPMQGYPEYQNRVWKWDFGPEGSTSATRKGWRLYAYVPDPKAAEPIPATAFFCYPKTEDPSGNRAKAIADRLRRFLAHTVERAEAIEAFKHQNDGRGGIISLCLTCFQTVAQSADPVEIGSAELAHECQALDAGKNT